MLRKMKRLSEEDALWLNRRELISPKYAKLYDALAGYDGIFDYFDIGIHKIREIQTFSWENSNETCDASQYTKTKFRTVSREYIYRFDKMDGSVHFQLHFYRERIGEEIECSIFVKILEKPSSIESVATEMDIICQCDDVVHRSLMRKQKLLSHGPTKGMIVFLSGNINANSSISWKFAIRMEPKQMIKAQSPVLEDRLDELLMQQYDELKERNNTLQKEFDILTEYNDGLMRKHEEKLMELEEIKKEKDTVNMLHSKKEKEVKRLQEQSKQNSARVKSKIRLFENWTLSVGMGKKDGKK